MTSPKKETQISIVFWEVPSAFFLLSFSEGYNRLTNNSHHWLILCVWRGGLDDYDKFGKEADWCFSSYIFSLYVKISYSTLFHCVYNFVFFILHLFVPISMFALLFICKPRNKNILTLTLTLTFVCTDLSSLLLISGPPFLLILFVELFFWLFLSYLSFFLLRPCSLLIEPLVNDN